jgi:hypothetical protein
MLWFASRHPRALIERRMPSPGRNYVLVLATIVGMGATWRSCLTTNLKWRDLKVTQTLLHPVQFGPIYHYRLCGGRRFTGATMRALIREYLFVSPFRAYAQSLESENASPRTFHRLSQNKHRQELFDVVSGFQELGKEKRRLK